jgi:hypothetical protein
MMKPQNSQNLRRALFVISTLSLLSLVACGSGNESGSSSPDATAPDNVVADENSPTTPSSPFTGDWHLVSSRCRDQRRDLELHSRTELQVASTLKTSLIIRRQISLCVIQIKGKIQMGLSRGGATNVFVPQSCELSSEGENLNACRGELRQCQNTIGHPEGVSVSNGVLTLDRESLCKDTFSKN